LQEETAATLSRTEETLAATNKELDDTKLALADMTALQEETAATLSQTEETLAATNKELDDTKLALADMTALQADTAAVLSQTEETLAATTKELDETKATLAEISASQTEPAAADEPAWTYYEFGGYGTALLDGWTRTMESEDGQLQYFFYGNSFVMIGAIKAPAEPKTEADILDAYEGIKEGYISSGMQNVTHEIILVNGHKACLVHGQLRGMPVDMMVYYVPGQENVYSFSYARLDNDTERHEQIINLAIRHTAVVKEMEVAPVEEETAQEAAPAAAPAVDYPDDAKFEADLNAGKDLTGKTVTFEIVAYKPTSALGYNLWAGEHLNFVSDTAPQFTTVGEKVTVRVTQVKQTLGSFVIRYEVVE
ncbi:MAG: hypothetical protein IKM05_07765, partial [Clostridia bacterium]|nr:hypothetical protein [Clostridia bacterium]